jgi:hypothetical protein
MIATWLVPCVLLALVVVLGGCSNLIYWTRADATIESFLADHEPCFDAAYVGSGIGSEASYKLCMRGKGWRRTQSIYGNGYLPEPHFRGPEGDDEFTPADRARFRSQIRN